MLPRFLPFAPVLLALACRPAGSVQSGGLQPAGHSCPGESESDRQSEHCPIADPKGGGGSLAKRASVGFTRAKFEDKARQRPVWVDFWYPTDDASEPQEHRYGLATGRVIADASPQTGEYDLVLLSHGAGGGGADYAWLAESLARSGFVVAGVHHFGESRVYGESSLDRRALFRVWERAEDVAFAYSQIMVRPQWAMLVEGSPVYGVGHSAGGHSMLAAAGVDYDVARLGPYCESEQAQDDLGCAYARDLTVEARDAIGTATGLVSSVVPFSALMLMEPALAPSFGAEALASFETPVLLAATTPGDFLPYKGQAAFLAKNLKHPKETLLSGGAGHFVFLSECTLPIRVHGVPLCEDREGVDRKEVHDKLAFETMSFFHLNRTR